MKKENNHYHSLISYPIFIISFIWLDNQQKKHVMLGMVVLMNSFFSLSFIHITLLYISLNCPLSENTHYKIFITSSENTNSKWSKNNHDYFVKLKIQSEWRKHIYHYYCPNFTPVVIGIAEMSSPEQKEINTDKTEPTTKKSQQKWYQYVFEYQKPTKHEVLIYILFFILWIPFIIMSYFMEGMSSSSSANG